MPVNKLKFEQFSKLVVLGCRELARGGYIILG